MEERCDGYKDEMINVIADILRYEYSHRVSRTTIQKKINDKCNSAASFLAAQRSQGAKSEFLDS